ncbi:MAG: (d)CMP kinase [Halobacteriaceae archaeon]
MLLTVSGPPGSGKTTLAKSLAEDFAIEHISGGDIFRQMASDRDLTLAEFNTLAEEDPQIDRDLDRRLREIAKTRDDIVLESRLSGWMAGDYATLKIWLNAPLDVRAKRIANRENKSHETAIKETKRREQSETKRYREYYGIEFDDLSIYDLSINTARWSEDAVRKIADTAVTNYNEDDDEGPIKVSDVQYEFDV